MPAGLRRYGRLLPLGAGLSISTVAVPVTGLILAAGLVVGLAAGLVVGLVVGLAPGGASAQSPPLQLDLPLDCIPGETCWIVHYVDVDTTSGASDYRCGGMTYNGHKGTDIAIRDLAEMNKGVPVFAAAAGTVIGSRDGMRDVDVREIGGPKALKGKDCGNGVHIRNTGGWTTQYCHMRLGSIMVRTGDRIKAGQQLGLVGLSGRTNFPHLHLTVRHDKKIVDPFKGISGADECALGRAPLWKPEVLRRLGYRPVHLFSAGIMGAKPTKRELVNGGYGKTVLSKDSPALVLWVGTFWPRSGDRLTFTITDAQGRRILKYEKTVTKKRPRAFYFTGRKRKGAYWPVGKYVGEVRLVRENGIDGREEYSITREITIR